MALASWSSAADTPTQLWRSNPTRKELPQRSEWYATDQALTATDTGTSKTITLGESGSVYGILRWVVSGGGGSYLELGTVNNDYDLRVGASDLTVTLDDNAGAKVVEVLDSGSAQVWRVDSDGNQELDGSLTFGDATAPVLSRVAASTLGLNAANKFLLNADTALAASYGVLGADNYSIDAGFIFGQNDVDFGYAYWDVDQTRFYVGAGAAPSNTFISFDNDGEMTIVPRNQGDAELRLGWSPITGPRYFEVWNDNAAGVRAYISSNGAQWLYDDLLVDGANIGITADPDLLAMALNALIVNGDVYVDGFDIGTTADPDLIHLDANTSVTVNSGLEVTGGGAFGGNLRTLAQMRADSLKVDTGPIYLPAASIADAALSTNVMLLNNEQTVVAHKNFSTDPTINGTRASDFTFNSDGTDVANLNIGFKDSTVTSWLTFTLGNPSLCEFSDSSYVNTRFKAMSFYAGDSYLGQDGQFILYSAQGTPDYTVTINPHALMTQNVALTLPADDGTGVQQLTGDGSGNLTFAGQNIATTASPSFAGGTFSGAVQSTVATGTAPLTVASTTVATNLNADLLDGQTGSYYVDSGNLTGTISTDRYSAYADLAAESHLQDSGTPSSGWAVNNDGTNENALINFNGITYGQLFYTAATGTFRLSNNSSYVPAPVTAGTFQSGENNYDGQLVIYSEQTPTDYTVTINPHAVMTQNVTYTLPADDGDANEVLSTNGSGALDWTAPVVGGASALASAYIWVGNSKGVATAVAMSGDVAIDNVGATAIQANAVALGTDTTGNYVATIADSGASEVTVANSGSESAAITLALASSITRDTEWDTWAEHPAIASGSILYGNGSNQATVGADIPTAVTIGSAYVYRAGGTDIPLADGGTAASLSASTGGIVYSGASAFAVLSGTATANKVLVSGATAAPTWSTPTFPNASATAGKIIVSDGTNWVASTPTYPNASATTGKMVRSDGTNFAASAATYPDTGTAYRLPVFSATNVMTELAAVGATGEYLAGATGAIPAWATLNQAAVAGLTTASSPQFANLVITGMGDIRPSVDSTTAINIANAAGTDFVVFDSSNKRAGVGSANAPGAPLDVYSQASSVGLRLSNVGGDGAGIWAYSATPTFIWSIARCDTTFGTGSLNINAYGGINFYGGVRTAPTTTLSHMFVTSAGKVGIGTIVPATALQVVGAATVGIDGTDGSLVVYSEQGATDYTTTISPPVAMTQNVVYTLPPNDGDASQQLTTDGAGALTWAGIGSATGTTADTFTVNSDTKNGNASVYFGGDTGNYGQVTFVNATQTFALRDWYGTTYLPIRVGAVYSGADGGVNGSMTFYSSGTETAPTVAAEADGDLTITAATGNIIPSTIVSASPATFTYLTTGSNESLAHDVIRHTVTAGEVTSLSFTESWSKATYAKVVSMHACKMVAAGTAVVTEHWTGGDFGLLYESSTIYVYSQASVNWAAGDIVTIYVVYEA